MPLRCLDCQTRLLEHASETDVRHDDVRAHLDSCATCAKFAVRAALHRRAFGDLVRLGIPSELDGRVVAACHAGYRQERAVARIANLARWNVPTELDRKVLEPQDGRSLVERSTAPDVLDRLVSEDLRDPAKAIARRFAGRLERLRAPAELRRRVERVFGARVTARMPRLPRFLQLAAAVLLVAVGGGLFLMRPKPERRYSFEVRHASAQASVDPMIRGMLNGLSGGLLDATQGGQR